MSRAAAGELTRLLPRGVWRDALALGLAPGLEPGSCDYTRRLLCHLSYTSSWWDVEDSNLRLIHYERTVLPAELTPHAKASLFLAVSSRGALEIFTLY